MRGNVPANENKEDFNLLRRFRTALAVTLMHKHFLHEFKKYVGCQRVEVFVFFNKGYKLVG